ncbi:hypothetical protein GOBAR_DD05469 [Gossypium barbadense]|nr:hypothetical protein GOBAR_DD05469 [Gossypium barbadense]
MFNYLLLLSLSSGRNSNGCISNLPAAPAEGIAANFSLPAAISSAKSFPLTWDKSNSILPSSTSNKAPVTSKHYY